MEGLLSTGPTPSSFISGEVGRKGLGYSVPAGTEAEPKGNVSVGGMGRGQYCCRRQKKGTKQGRAQCVSRGQGMGRVLLQGVGARDNAGEGTMCLQGLGPSCQCASFLSSLTINQHFSELHWTALHCTQLNRP